MRSSLAKLATLALASAAAASPGRTQELPRPKLEAQADTNDWEAYFDHAAKLLPDRPSAAEAGFYWAQRLAPDRAEPLVGHWVAFHLRDYKRWKRHLEDDEKTLRDPVVVAHDSLRWQARAKNPFVSEGLIYYLYDQMPGQWAEDSWTRGFLKYAATKFDDAIPLFQRDVKNNARKRPWVRWWLAQALIGARRYAEALAQVDTLRAALDSAAQRTTVTTYESKEVLDLGAAFLRRALGDTAGARADAERALTESFAFYPAHLFLGDMARSHQDADGALREYELAAQLAPGEPVAQFSYGAALSTKGETAKALAALRRATELEPYYAVPWLGLARLLDAIGDAAGARAAYQSYIDRAPRSSGAAIAQARARLAALGAR